MIKFLNSISIIPKKRYKYLILAVFTLAMALGIYVAKYSSQDIQSEELELYVAFNKAAIKIEDIWKYGSTKTSLPDGVRLDLYGGGSHWP